MLPYLLDGKRYTAEEAQVNLPAVLKIEGGTI